MKKFPLKYIFFFVILIVVIFIVGQSLTQPGVADLETDFKEVAFYRNENNTGPVIRVYAVAVSDTSRADLEQYAGFMPHNKYGNTKVFFFLRGKPYPKTVTPGDENFDGAFEEFLVAKYEKDGLGRESFVAR